jgi:hypothetical protein
MLGVPREDSDMTRSTRASWLAATFLLLAAPRAWADDPCAADSARFCSGKTPVELLSCLQSHRADLASDCRDYLEFSLVSVQAMIQDCEPDAFQLCRGVGRGVPTATCLSDNQGKLTRRCQDDFDAFTRAETASAKACADDARRICPAAKAGKGDLFLCLLYKGKDLSPACRAAMRP